MTNMSITIDSGAYPEFIDNSSGHSDHHANNGGIAHSGRLGQTPSLEQVPILGHVAILLQLLTPASHHPTNLASVPAVPASRNIRNVSVEDVDDKDIAARINGLLELL
ncbi:hypothetical protein FYJ51_11880 [Erysipelotrichaceae bacterium Oil+RF-744-GAM-WT-6]|uniref:Uncharacterized protein n=1 Tax=Stecheria intestinalis TaxID=2606630 RepID=A0A7X2NU51_9FIRM|nr:hypothetical protein [Stecheria intestinalis]MSS59591.1 hypothetical protein [Stecheria intestinalis]